MNFSELEDAVDSSGGSRSVPSSLARRGLVFFCLQFLRFMVVNSGIELCMLYWMLCENKDTEAFFSIFLLPLLVFTLKCIHIEK